MKFRHLAATTAAALFIAIPNASAHISLHAESTAAGSHAVLHFDVGHGCEGSPTTKIELQVPDGVTGFTPERTTFWDVEVTTKPGDAETQDGEEVSEVPDVVTWTATTPLPNAEYDRLGALVTLPDDEGQLNFPVVQTCAKGSTSWTQVVGDGDEPENPAPYITVTKGSGDGHGHGGDEAEKSDEGGHSMSDADHSKDVDDLKDDVDMARTWAIIGIVVGALGLLFGLIGMRGRKR